MQDLGDHLPWGLELRNSFLYLPSVEGRLAICGHGSGPPLPVDLHHLHERRDPSHFPGRYLPLAPSRPLSLRTEGPDPGPRPAELRVHLYSEALCLSAS